MTNSEPQVSQLEIYHKLGKLEGLMETMMATITSFQGAIRDVHARIDSLEARQASLESQQSQESGASNAIATLAKDFALPVVAVIVAWFAGKGQTPPVQAVPQQLQPTPGIAEHSGVNRSYPARPAAPR